MAPKGNARFIAKKSMKKEISNFGFDRGILRLCDVDRGIQNNPN